LAVLTLFIVVQWTENNIVVPVVMNKVLGVRSLIIFLTMLIAAWLFGFIGVVMAVPLAVIVTTFWSDIVDNTKSSL
jgi:predicted PurR-regulated permease PerM